MRGILLLRIRSELKAAKHKHLLSISAFIKKLEFIKLSINSGDVSIFAIAAFTSSLVTLDATSPRTPRFPTRSVL